MNEKNIQIYIGFDCICHALFSVIFGAIACYQISHEVSLYGLTTLAMAIYNVTKFFGTLKVFTEK